MSGLSRLCRTHHLQKHSPDYNTGAMTGCDAGLVEELGLKNNLGVPARAHTLNPTITISEVRRVCRGIESVHS